MKKFFPFILLASLTLFAVSCSDNSRDTVVDNDTYSVVYEATGTFTSPSYSLVYDFPRRLYATDMVLVYRLKTVENGQKVWEALPKTYYLAEGEINYEYDFTSSDVKIYMQFTLDPSTRAEYTNNQTFRMLVIPAGAGKAKVDLSNYNEVVKFYNLNENHIKTLK
ncbi:hypothetical protein [Bergeyella sp. RCAD1439]|uniref:hypothetical protein n=1 Tax=Bergeyella anatis TaxID=3113737 RepID=UPI002E171C9C|nr:hypothetical protein [Bergeyella sp. RCAD1439]